MGLLAHVKWGVVVPKLRCLSGCVDLDCTKWNVGKLLQTWVLARDFVLGESPKFAPAEAMRALKLCGGHELG